MLLRVLFFAVFCGTATAATYYVDFDSGSDSNNGISTATPWKHCPGDPNATAAAGIVLSPGDTVNFKGGVRYRGRIQVTAGGTSASRIIYNGNSGWGVGKAIIDGSVPLPLQRCTGNGTGVGQVPNANYASIYSAPLPANSNVLAPVLENDVWLALAQSAPQPVPFFWKDVQHFHTSGTVSATSTVDPTRLNQADPAYWVGAYVVMRANPGNDAVLSKITAFDPATRTISYGNAGNVHSDRYAIVSEPRLLSGPGQYAIDETRQLVFVWPLANPAAVTIGVQPFGFHTNGCSYVSISGFVISGQYGTTYATGRAIAGSNSTPTNGVIISNCDIRNHESHGASGATYLLGAGAAENEVNGCTFSYLHGRGPFIAGSRIAVRNSEISYVDGTCIYSQNGPGAFPNVNGEISGNYIHHVSGVHQNGITVYGEAGGSGASYAAANWKIFGNRVLGMVNPYGNGALTLQGHRNMLVYNNVFEADGGCPIDNLAAGSEYFRFYNNTVTVPPNTRGSPIAGVVRLFGLANSATNEFRNNICNGLIIADAGSGSKVDWSRLTHTNNLYTALSSSQSAQLGWIPGPGEATATAAAIFVDPSKSDYNPRRTGPAMAAGTALSSYFTTDLPERLRVDLWEIGAYEYYVLHGKPPIWGQ